MNQLDVFRSKLAAGRMCVGTGITFSDPAVSECIAEAGYDFTWIDMEHGPIDLETALGHVTALGGTDTAPFVRVRCNDVNVIKPVLDLNPAAVIVPMVNTADEAENAIAACRYPPRGVRGYGPRRGTRYGATPMADYIEHMKDRPAVILQIEHIEAVGNIDAILKVPDIDSICLGPNDLSGSMGKLGQIDDPHVDQAMRTVAKKTGDAGITLGVSTGYSEQNLDRWVGLGVQWINLNVDWANLFKISKEIADAAHARRPV